MGEMSERISRKKCDLCVCYHVCKHRVDVLRGMLAIEPADKTRNTVDYVNLRLGSSCVFYFREDDKDE